MSKKKMFYVWQTRDEAGIEESYDECMKQFHGKPGGRCKKFNTRGDATKALEEKLQYIKERGDKSGKRVSNETEEDGTTTSASDHDRPENHVENGGHDERYEEFSSFKSMQVKLNETIENTLTSLSIELNEQFTELKDHECQTRNMFKELKIYLNNEIDMSKRELQKSLQKDLTDLQNTTTKLKNELRKLKSQLDKAAQRPVSISSITQTEPTLPNDTSHEEVANLTFYNVETSNSFEPMSGEEADLTDSHITTQYQNTEPSSQTNNSQQQIQEREPLQREENGNHPTFNRTQDDDPSTRDGAILMLSDSIFRGVIQRKFSPQKYVNKQYVQGGTKEMLHHINSMPDEEMVHYESVVIHTGTNDVDLITTAEICENTATIVALAQQKWPLSKIVVSGLTYQKYDVRKNNIIDEINYQSEITCHHFSNASFLNNKMVTQTRNGATDNKAFFDNVHLNNHVGTKKLVANLKNHLGLRRQRNANTQRQPRPWRPGQGSRPGNRPAYQNRTHSRPYAEDHHNTSQELRSGNRTHSRPYAEDHHNTSQELRSGNLTSNNRDISHNVYYFNGQEPQDGRNFAQQVRADYRDYDDYYYNFISQNQQAYSVGEALRVLSYWVNRND